MTARCDWFNAKFAMWFIDG